MPEWTQQGSFGRGGMPPLRNVLAGLEGRQQVAFGERRQIEMHWAVAELSKVAVIC